MAIWYSLWPSGKFFPVSACCSKKNLATLISCLRDCKFRLKRFFLLGSKMQISRFEALRTQPTAVDNLPKKSFQTFVFSLAGFFLVSTLKASGCVLKHFLPAYTRAS
jgi:hypothetical protein